MTRSLPAATSMPLTHAALALGLIVAGLLLGVVLPILLIWPMYLLAPLLVYGGVVLFVPSLRRSVMWLRIGRLDRRAWAAAAVIVVVSSSALVVWHELAKPDLAAIVEHIPRWSLPSLIAAGIVFSCVNALLEEVLFRGLLYDALRASYGVMATLAIQAIAFGAVHATGFPSGAIGVVLASIYGLMQGWLRVYADGLGVCWVAHVCADATIFILLMQHR